MNCSWKTDFQLILLLQFLSMLKVWFSEWIHCIYSSWLKSATFYHSFQFPLHGNYQLVFSRLAPDKKFTEKENFKQADLSRSLLICSLAKVYTHHLNLLLDYVLYLPIKPYLIIWWKEQAILKSKFYQNTECPSARSMQKKFQWNHF